MVSGGCPVQYVAYSTASKEYVETLQPIIIQQTFLGKQHYGGLLLFFFSSVKDISKIILKKCVT